MLKSLDVSSLSGRAFYERVCKTFSWHRSGMTVAYVYKSFKRAAMSFLVWSQARSF